MTSELNTAKGARDCLHLAAIEAWQAIASGRPAPAIDPLALYQDLHDAFTVGSGITVDGADGDLRPGIDDAITCTVIASIWFGITTGYLTLAGSYHIPRKFLV